MKIRLKVVVVTVCSVVLFALLASVIHLRAVSSYGLDEWIHDGSRSIIDRRRSSLGLRMRNSHDLVGRSLAQTLNLLGEPDRLTYGGDLVYVLGPDPNYGIDIWELHIKFGKYGIVQATTIESY